MASDGGKNYSYDDAGFDDFLLRNLDGPAKQNLQAVGNSAPQQSVAFDQTAVTGMLGNTLVIGNIRIDGVTGRISVYDDAQNEVVRIGEQNG